MTKPGPCRQCWQKWVWRSRLVSGPGCRIRKIGVRRCHNLNHLACPVLVGLSLFSKNYSGILADFLSCACTLPIQAAEEDECQIFKVIQVLLVEHQSRKHLPQTLAFIWVVPYPFHNQDQLHRKDSIAGTSNNR